jgi:hypothetical protein
MDNYGIVIRFPAGAGFFSLFQNAQTGLNPPSLLFNEDRGYAREGKDGNM